MKLCTAITWLAVIAGLSGCTIVNGTSIVTGGEREPTSPEQIRIYRETPHEYEELQFRWHAILLESVFEWVRE